MTTSLVWGVGHLVSHAPSQLPDRHFVPLHVVVQLARLGCCSSGLDSANNNLFMIIIEVVVVAITVHIAVSERRAVQVSKRQAKESSLVCCYFHGQLQGMHACAAADIDALPWLPPVLQERNGCIDTEFPLAYNNPFKPHLLSIIRGTTQHHTIATYKKEEKRPSLQRVGEARRPHHRCTSVKKDAHLIDIDIDMYPYLYGIRTFRVSVPLG